MFYTQYIVGVGAFRPVKKYIYMKFFNLLIFCA